MNKIRNMSVGQIYMNPEDWGDENDPTSDWCLVQTVSCFSHDKDACEFIVCVTEDDYLNTFKEAGLSDNIVNICKRAKDQGFSYLCFYS